MIPKVGDIWMYSSQVTWTIDFLLEESVTDRHFLIKTIDSNKKGMVGDTSVYHIGSYYTNISSNLSRLLYDV